MELLKCLSRKMKWSSILTEPILPSIIWIFFKGCGLHGEKLVINWEQHIVRRLPFRYKVRYSGTLSVGEKADIVELHKGEKVVVTWDGHITVSKSHKAKSGKVMIYATHTLNLFLGDYLTKWKRADGRD